MSEREIEEEREERIENEIVVDAYDEWERASGWHNYLGDCLAFPFRAHCILERRTSPLRAGEEVEVIDLISEEADDLGEILAEVRWQDRTLGVPLMQLESLDPDEEREQAMADWRYWVERGYQF